MTAHRHVHVVTACLLSGALAIVTSYASHADDADKLGELANPLAVHSLDRLPDTRERPLFSPTRRPRPLPPAVVQAAEPPPPPAPPPDVALLGVVIDGEEARAVIRAGVSNKTVRARIGDEIGGWKITQIDGRQIVLSLGDRSATFTMFNRDGARSRTPSGSSSNPIETQMSDQVPQASPREGKYPNPGEADSLGKPIPAPAGRKNRRGKS
jgi:general secretion pathway protein N